MATEIQYPNLPLPDYFSDFAKNYVRHTGRSTLHILSDVIKEIVQTGEHPIGPDSVVHDTAAGPGIGAAAIIANLAPHKFPKEILVSDNDPMMVTAAHDSLVRSRRDSIWVPMVKCEELDSQAMPSIPDNHFTHSINNFSISDFTRPDDAIRETYRTLCPGGLAVVTCWRRFPPMVIVHAAQKEIRPDLQRMHTPNPQFYEEGKLQKVIEKAGFTDIKIFEKQLLITDKKNIAGLTGFMTGSRMEEARECYTEDDEAKWPETVNRLVIEEQEKFGGILFHAYVLLASKPA